MIRLRLFALLALVAIVWGCASEIDGIKLPDSAPRVWLSSAPPEGTVTGYTLHLFWGGWDPDGEIDFYEYIITDNETGVFDPADTTSTPGDYKWNAVFGNDSIFDFTADVVNDSTELGTDTDTGFDPDGQEPEEFRRNHTFFIRSVDREGNRSVPAYRSFTSRTLSPTVQITVPSISNSPLNPARVPPISTFRWVGRDPISDELLTQDPCEVRHILVPVLDHSNNPNDFVPAEEYIRTTRDAPEWSDWVLYNAPMDSGRSWTTPLLAPTNYVFAVQVRDEAGAVTPVFDRRRNLRRLRVTNQFSGPILILSNEFLGSVISTGLNSNCSILDIPAGVDMCFELGADASSYGGVEAGYRYGWDIQDLNDPSQWDIDFTPFIGGETARAQVPCRRFFFGSHVFFVEVIDNSGFRSRVCARVNIIPFTFERPLLLVDDWQEGLDNWAQNNGAEPSDGQHDAFWEDQMLGDVAGFEPVQDVFEVGIGNNTVPIQKVAQYANVVWVATAAHTSGSASAIQRMIEFKDPTGNQPTQKAQPNIPALYMAAGGHMIMAGQSFMTMVINRFFFPGGNILVYPLIFRYEMIGDQDGAYTGEGNDVGERGVGEKSFAYRDCCLNVVDVNYISAVNTRRRDGCPGRERPFLEPNDDHNRDTSGMTAAEPDAGSGGVGFPALTLRPEAGAPGRFYDPTFRGLVADIYNPSYLADPLRADCNGTAELLPARPCFEPIYNHVCNDTDSWVFGEPVAFWTGTHAEVVPDVPNGVGGRSAVFGFAPVYFEPDSVKKAMDIILFDEWQLQRQ